MYVFTNKEPVESFKKRSWMSCFDGHIVQLLSTKIVQISDTSMKLSQITKGPKGNIFWCRAKPN